jgi:hypothetical protein
VGVAIVGLLQATGAVHDRVAATNLARKQIDDLRLRNSTGHALVTTSTVPPQYTVTTTLNPTAVAVCSLGSVRSVTVTVSWGTAPQRSVTIDSELAC